MALKNTYKIMNSYTVANSSIKIALVLSLSYLAHLNHVGSNDELWKEYA